MRQVGSRPIYQLLDRMNHLICRHMYRLARPVSPPLPKEGPVIVVANHVSYSDPMVLAATAGRGIRFLMAREIYEHSRLRWVFDIIGNIPVSRGARDIAAVRTVLAALEKGEVIGIFPEGGIDEYRQEGGYLGVGYLALKTGAPVVPAAISWDQARPMNLVGSLLTPGRVLVRYGPPILTRPDPRPRPDTIRAVTSRVMSAIRDLEKSSG